MGKIKNKSLEIIGRNQFLQSLFDKFVSEDLTLRFEDKNIVNSIDRDSSFTVRDHKFSMIEETHHFAYQTSFECYLFCDNFEQAKPYFFSERYFLTNSVIKTIGA